MFEKKEIYEVCKNTINKFKDIDNDLYIQMEPFVNWIKSDPEKVKAKAIINDVKFITKSLLECKNQNEQKKNMKTIIFNEELTAAALFPILLLPNPENLDELNYFPHKNIKDKNFSNYIKWLASNDPWTAVGITEEKSFLNAAVIIQKYSISRIVSLVFQECLEKIGVNGIKSKAQALSKDSFQNILKIIPLISNDGILDDSKLSDEYKFFLKLKVYADISFLENNDN